jgi:UDP-N-acetylmuramate dehydrogenase
MHGSQLSAIELQGDTVVAQAGAPLSKLCTFAMENGLTGLEFAYGIPGSVGGAVYMNAGAMAEKSKTFYIMLNPLINTDILRKARNNT